MVTPTKYPKGLTWSPNMRNQFKITSWRTRAIGNLWPVDVPFGEVLRTQSFYLPGKTELLPKYEKGLKEGSVGRFFGPDSLDCITMPAPQTRVDSGCRRPRLGGKERTWMIMGVDYRPGDQYTASADSKTGECGERRRWKRHRGSLAFNAGCVRTSGQAHKRLLGDHHFRGAAQRIR